MFKNTKSPLFYKYLFSYISILAIPIIILGGLLYNNLNKSYWEEITNYRKINANHLINTFESEYKIINSIALRIAFDALMSMSVIKQNDYQSKNASNTLSRYIAESSIINEIYLYFKDDNRVYCSRGVMSIYTMFGSDFSFSESEKAYFMELMSNTKGILIKRINQSSDDNQIKTPLIVIVYSLPIGQNNPYGTMTFVLRQDRINKVLGLKNENDFCFYIFNKNKDIVYLNGSEGLIDSGVLDMIWRGNDSVYNDKNNFVINVKSELAELDYVIVYSNKNIGERWKTNLHIYLIFVFIILFGIFIASIMASRNYKPIKKIIDNFFDVADRRINQKRINEMEYIDNLIKDTIDKNKKLLAKLNEQLPFMKEQVLLMLIKGEMVNSALAESLMNSCGISFDYNYFQVMIISFFNYSRSEIVSGRVSNIIKMMLSEYNPKVNYYIIELLRGDRVIILNGNRDELEKDKVKYISEKIQHTLKMQLKIKTNIGIGSITNSLEYVSVSFEEAQYALDYKLITGYGNVIFYVDCVKESNNVFWYPMEEMMNFSNFIKQGDAKAAIECMNSIFKNIKSRNVPIGIGKSIGYDIINTVIRIINEYNISGYKEEIENISEYETIEELENGLTSSIGKICGYFNEYKSNKNKKLKVELVKYINENFKNPLISLELIAEEFGLTEKYLSKFFYQNTGYRFADYIKRLRIDYAKKLLVETDKTVKEIVELSGYTDPSSFIRTFSYLEGVTPGRYRELNRA
ncbi:MAG: AraC family transcriptional regulator [Firmicutes bacterium]|nr:AraC family transcriptional regulator [Bacillota bacterium]